jgi:hypothetical protein
MRPSNHTFQRQCPPKKKPEPTKEPTFLKVSTVEELMKLSMQKAKPLVHFRKEESFQKRRQKEQWNSVTSCIHQTIQPRAEIARHLLSSTDSDNYHSLSKRLLQMSPSSQNLPQVNRARVSP